MIYHAITTSGNHHAFFIKDDTLYIRKDSGNEEKVIYLQVFEIRTGERVFTRPLGEDHFTDISLDTHIKTEHDLSTYKKTFAVLYSDENFDYDFSFPDQDLETIIKLADYTISVKNCLVDV